MSPPVTQNCAFGLVETCQAPRSAGGAEAGQRVALEREQEPLLLGFLEELSLFPLEKMVTGGVPFNPPTS